MESCEFLRYVNKPECPVLVGERYIRSDMLTCDEIYTVKSIEEKDGKYYALCEYNDSFDDSIKEELIYVFYLKECK